jgi:hypothetical protein
MYLRSILNDSENILKGQRGNACRRNVFIKCSEGNKVSRVECERGLSAMNITVTTLRKKVPRAVPASQRGGPDSLSGQAISATDGVVKQHT